MRLNIKFTAYLLILFPLHVFGDDFVRFDDTGAGKKYSLDEIKHIQEKVVDTRYSCLDRTKFESLVSGNIQLASYSIIELQKYNPDEECSNYSTSSETIYIFYKGKDNYTLIGRIFGGDGYFSFVNFLGLNIKESDNSIPVLVTEFIQSGTGHFSHFSAFNLTTSFELQEIMTNFNNKDLPLHRGQGIWKGPYYRAENNKLYANVSVWNQGDGNCCPTGGQITIGLMLVRKQDRFLLEYDLNDITAPSESSRFDQLGLKNYGRKDFDLSIDNFKKAIRYNRENYEALSNLSLAYYRIGKYKDSIKAAAIVISSNKSSQVQKASAYYNVGKSYEKLGDFVKAFINYKKSVEMKPNKAREDALERVRAKIN